VRKKILLVLLLCFYIVGLAQNKDSTLSAKGYFLSDSIQIGNPIPYAFVVKRSSQTQILLPDSTYNFFPFELKKITYFTTQTKKNISVDSVLYEFVTFEVQPKLYLKLPVWLSHEKDSIHVQWTKLDSVALQEMVKTTPFISLKANTNFYGWQEYFNYPYWIAGILVFLLVVFLVWLLLGRRIIKAYTMFQFNTRHAIFLNEFGRLSNRISSRQAVEDIEKSITLWKKHLEQIENKPYSSYTSKEINEQLKDSNLAEALKSIDKAVYGQEVSLEITQALKVLRNLSIIRFEIRKEELRNV
jgi:hypothetical protein